MSAHPAGPRHEVPHAPTIEPRPESPGEMLALDPAVWPRGAARRADDGVVEFAGVGVDELAERFGTPLFVLDEDDFRSRCREMADAFGGAANVHYAAKAFLCTEVARWVDDEGLSLDVASGGELAVALRAGFPPARITVHGNNKSAEELRLAVRSGVAHVVVDCMGEIAMLDRIAAAEGVVQDVFVRVTVGVEAHTHEFIATAHEDQKFGFSLAGGAAMEAIRSVVDSANLRLTGLHSHIGSQIFDIDGFEMAARRMISLLREVVDTFGPEQTADLRTVDLGGGLGISYVASDDPPPVSELAEKLLTIVNGHAEQAGLPTPTVLVEPGRAIAGPCGVTVYRVGATKDVHLPGGRSRRYIGVDGGMSDNIRTALYDAAYDARLVGRPSLAEPLVSRLVGKHCESGDVVVRDLWMPADVGDGDLVAVAATGAYCYSMSSRYNLIGRPAVVAVRDGEARLILRRETFDDLISLEVEQ